MRYFFLIPIILLSACAVGTPITSYEDCVAAGYGVMKSLPEQCRANGTTFTRDIGNAQQKADRILAEAPQPGDIISSPVSISGTARGIWFFEGSFPAELRDDEGNTLGNGIMHSVGNWMTEEFVPFVGALDFKMPKGKHGKLILKRDNPSGLPENEDALIIPVRF